MNFPSVRPMQAKDLPGALALWAKAEGVEVAEGDLPSQLAAFLERNPQMSAVAVWEGAIVGAVLAGHDGRRGYLYHLAVAEEVRGSGLGRALVEHALGKFKRAGIERTLVLVAKDNQGGRAFWKQLGWETLEFAEVMGRDV